MTAAPTFADADARLHIERRTDRTMFVEAGAGSGKTRSLIRRIVAVVLGDDDPQPLSRIAAVTFSERAAAELRERLRRELELHADDPRAAEALEQLDAAAIGTLHGFARRILTEHSVAAGLPPEFEVLDETGSQLAFDDRWVTLRAALLDDPEAEPDVTLALAAGVRVNDLRDVVRAFTDNWDLLEARVLDGDAPPPPPVPVEALTTVARGLAGWRAQCSATDPLRDELAALDGWAARLEGATDEPVRLELLAWLAAFRWSKAEPQTQHLARGCRDLSARAAADRDRITDAALRRLARRLATTVLAEAHRRHTDGRLEFHDLLVLARDLVRHDGHGAAVRTTLQDRYRRLLLDEFQDTDPIQIELAVRIAGGAAAGCPDWTDVAVPAGSVFVVGDPMQSIYRFRRADIGLYLRARHRLGEAVVLDTNFRTRRGVLDWINHTFATLVQPDGDGQPEFHPLQPVRESAPDAGGPPVLVFGATPHADSPTADELRRREAADTAASVCHALAGWRVGDDHRPCRPADIAVLVPTRAAVPFLTAAFDEAGIAYVPEASSSALRSRAVRDLMLAARAVDDPADTLALVSCLRTPLFGCGDDDLLRWRRTGGRWDFLAPLSDDADGPVAEALRYLASLHRVSASLPPADILTRLIEDRRMTEVAAGRPGARDVWRHLRMVVDQARGWPAHPGGTTGGLRGWLRWAARRAQEANRSADTPPAETDVDAVRIMTVHAAKGLEFPVVILAGTGTKPGWRPGVDVLWPATGGYALGVRRDLATGGFGALQADEQRRDRQERLRLLYVAATRARDHLVVSLHRRPDRTTDAATLAEGCRGAAHAVLPAGPHPRMPSVPALTATPPPPYDEWAAHLHRLRTEAARPAALTASALPPTPAPTPTDAARRDSARPGTALPAPTNPARPDPALTGATWPDPALTDPAQPHSGRAAIDPGLAKDPRDLDRPPWHKGRYGTAVGRAVHAVLQTVDLSTGEGVAEAVATQAVAEDVTDRTELVATLVRHALSSEPVRQAAATRHHREIYVGTTENGVVIEGMVDLLYDDPATSEPFAWPPAGPSTRALVVLDYKTVPALPADPVTAASRYESQLSAYATAVTAATGRAVSRRVVLFLAPEGALAQELPTAAAPRPVAASTHTDAFRLATAPPPAETAPHVSETARLATAPPPSGTAPPPSGTAPPPSGTAPHGSEAAGFSTEPAPGAPASTPVSPASAEPGTPTEPSPHASADPGVPAHVPVVRSGSAYIENRRVYLVRGALTQTVNVCTATNVRGSCEVTYRLAGRDNYVTIEQVAERPTLAALRDWLLSRGAATDPRTDRPAPNIPPTTPPSATAPPTTPPSTTAQATSPLPITPAPTVPPSTTAPPTSPLPITPRPTTPPSTAPTTEPLSTTPAPTRTVLDDEWLPTATRITELAIDALVWEFVEHPYLHRVEHSLHARLFGILAAHPLFAHLLPIGTTGRHTQPVHKEWPETVPRPESDGRRGNFDLAVLGRAQLATATLDDFAQGRVPAAVVIELGLNYGLAHLTQDHDKLVNSRVKSGFLVHFSRGRTRDEQVERYLLDPLRQYRTAYAHHDPDGWCTFKTLDGPIRRIPPRPPFSGNGA